MKKIKVKGAPKKTEIMSSHSDEPKQSYRAECEECRKEITFSKADITHGAYGCVMVKCPKCGKRTYVPCEEEEIFLTKENLIFPDHFYNMPKNKELNTENETSLVNRLCREVLDELDSHKNIDWAEREVNRYAVIALKDNEETNLYVCNGYYHTSIPGTETIDFPEIKINS